MSILDLYKDQTEVPSLSKDADLRASRKENIDKVKNTQRFDVVIAGGGIQGAMFARLAALNGLKTLLLEINDYASGTSSKTSKMAHGGLRYLEYFDFKQVLEGVKAREEFFQTAPHLVRPNEFLIPIYEGEFFKKFKLGLGLTFYDFFLRDKQFKHQWISATPEMSALFSKNKKLLGYFRFYDGIMHDTRLVIENVYAARQEGAICLNYARVDSVYQDKIETEIAWTDTLSGEKYVCRTGIVVNTAGAWAPTMGRIKSGKLAQEVRFSQGTHLLFDKKWEHPALLIPLPGKGRNYFVWPHYAGTMVGTTEKELNAPNFDPVPTSEEVKEILSRIERDIPGAGLGKENLFYSFAGIRTLPSSGKANQTFKLSRKHSWSFSQGMLTLIGGKFTTAAWTALEGLNLLYKFAGIKRNVVSFAKRLMPGAYQYKAETENFTKACETKGVPQNVRQSCIRRLGARVRILMDLDPDLKLIENSILEADLKFALEYEQAETISDIFCRRLDLEFAKGQGLEILNPVASYLMENYPGRDWSKQAQEYSMHVQRVYSLL